MAICKKCGTILGAHDKFCPVCKKKAARPDIKKLSEFLLRSDDYTDAYSKKDIHAGKLFSVLCYIPVICLYPIIFKAKRSAFVRFHANQGVLVFTLNIIIAIAASLMALIWHIPILGPVCCIISGFIFSLSELANFAASVYGAICAALGKAKEIPLLGRIRLF